MSEKMDLDVESSDEDESIMRKVFIQMCDEEGENTTSSLQVPLNISPKQLQLLCNNLLKNEEDQLYSFFVNEKELKGTLETFLEKEKISIEGAIKVVYQPQASFKVRAVTRCSSSIQGHAEPVLTAQFSPDSRYLATGSGDKTVRFWDLNTETPRYTCKAHKMEILDVSWSPDGRKLASACKGGDICIWDPRTGKQMGKSMTQHKQWIYMLCWKPLHLDGECRKLASSSKDATVRIWDTKLGTCEVVLSGHLQPIRYLKWSGEDLIYTASQDTTIKVWRPQDGVLCRTLKNHGHWVSTLALNTDYVMRCGGFQPSAAQGIKWEEYDAMTSSQLQETAGKLYSEVTKVSGGEIMVSGSDDNTLSLWTPATDKKPKTKMTGHQALVFDVRFSPDARLIASASYDKSIKVWCGKSGKYLFNLFGHVSSVYKVSWSSDSRLLVSGSSDSTLKVWDVKKKKLLNDLPGHADEVYAVDWSTDGQKVASGGKDCVLKLWRK